MGKTIVIATVDSNNGLSRTNNVLWNLKEDNDFFKKQTRDNIVVMNRRHWIYNGRVKNCINFVMNKNAHDAGDFSGGLSELRDLSNKNPEKDILIIGGEEIFKLYSDSADEVILTRIKKNYGCDEFFPGVNENYEITLCENNLFSIEENSFYERIYYKSNGGVLHQEYKYLDIFEEIVNNSSCSFGCGVSQSRKSFQVYDKRLSFCLDNSRIPLMTTINTEYNKIFSKLFSVFNGNGDLGFQWRFFGCKYSLLFEYENTLDKKEVLGGVDQLAKLDKSLKENKKEAFIGDGHEEDYILTNINPLKEYSSPNVTCQFIKQEDKFLSLVVNVSKISSLKIHECVAFYSLLLYIFAKRSSRIANRITFNFGFIFTKGHQIEVLRNIIHKQPLPFPVVKVYDHVKKIKLENLSGLDFNICGYSYC